MKRPNPSVPRIALIAVAAFGSACAAAQSAPPATITEAARLKFGAAPAADIRFSAQNVDAADVIFLVDACMKIVPNRPTYWPTLKADGWLLESGKDTAADHGWEGVFIQPGHRGKLVEHIWQGDIPHCEARGETGSAERRSAIWDTLVAHYRAVHAPEFKGENGFIENIRNEAPHALKGMYVSATNMIFSHSDENPDSTVISVDVF